MLCNLISAHIVPHLMACVKTAKQVIINISRVLPTYSRSLEIVHQRCQDIIQFGSVSFCLS